MHISNLAARRNFRYDIPGSSKELPCNLLDAPDGGADAQDLPPQTAPVSLLWQAARCSSAAPTYFQSYLVGQMVFIDGGLVNNNPTLQAYTECTNLIRHLNRGATRPEERTRLHLVLSLGCSSLRPHLRPREQIFELSHIHREYSWRHYYRYVLNVFRMRGVAMLVQMLRESAFDTTSGVDEGIAWASGLGASFAR